MKIPISLLLFILTNLYSQHIHGRFMDADIFGKTVYLYDVFRGDGKPIDKANINNQGSFSFSERKFKLGFYRVQGKDIQPFIVVLNPMETEVEIQVNKKEDSEHVIALKSVENTVFNHHFYLLTNIYDRLESLLFAMSFPENNSTTNAYEMEEEFHRLSKYVTAAMKDITSKYSNTFTYEILNDLKPFYYDNYDTRLNKYFRSGTMKNSKFLRSPLTYIKMRNYLRYYSGENSVDMHIAIDEILLASHENYEVYRYCINEILFFLDREGRKDHIEYVISEYIGDEFDIIMKSSLRKRIEGMSKLTVGTEAPNLFIPDINGNKVALHDLYKNNKLNVLFFWSSRCQHCMKTLPKMIEIYDVYRSAGLEVIAISIDKKEEEWRQAIAQENLQWTNVSSLKGWDSKSTDIYFVSSTPTFYLVDNNANIIGRPDGKEEMINQVNNLLR